MRSTVRTPTYSGTTTSDWSRPDLEDYGYDSVDDIPSDASPHPAEHSFLGEEDGETWSEVSILPVVQPNGNLNRNALESAKTYVSQVEGITQDIVENVKEKADQLLRDEFDVEKALGGISSLDVEEFVTSSYKGVEKESFGKFTGVSKRELATLIGNGYDITAGEALEILNNISEFKKEMRNMEKEELIETIKKVRKGELEVSEALDDFIDVDSETIKEIKEELKEEEETVEEEKEDKTELDKEVEKMMEEENIDKSKAMAKVLDDKPELYEKYLNRGG